MDSYQATTGRVRRRVRAEKHLEYQDKNVEFQMC